MKEYFLTQRTFSLGTDFFIEFAIRSLQRIRMIEEWGQKLELLWCLGRFVPGFRSRPFFGEHDLNIYKEGNNGEVIMVHRFIRGGRQLLLEKIKNPPTFILDEMSSSLTIRFSDYKGRISDNYREKMIASDSDFNLFIEQE